MLEFLSNGGGLVAGFLAGLLNLLELPGGGAMLDEVGLPSRCFFSCLDISKI